MKAKLLLLALCCVCYANSLVAVAAEDRPPTFVNNPKLLKFPITLVRARMIAETTTATLQDTNGARFEFNLSSANNQLLVRSGAVPEMSAFPPAAFVGWNLDDFAMILQETIKRQFESEGKHLRPKNPQDFAQMDDATAHFTYNAAKRLLTWAESRQHRAGTSPK